MLLICNLLISDTGMEEEEKTVPDSLSEAISSSIIQDENVDEDEHKKILEKV